MRHALRSLFGVDSINLAEFTERILQLYLRWHSDVMRDDMLIVFIVF